MRRAVGCTAQRAADSQAFDYGFALPEKTDARSLFRCVVGAGLRTFFRLQVHGVALQDASNCPTVSFKRRKRNRERQRELERNSLSRNLDPKKPSQVRICIDSYITACFEQNALPWNVFKK